MNRKITIPKQFCGPPESGNGGYVVGLMAEPLNYQAEVSLRVPPPLDKEFELIGDGEGFKLMDGEIVVAISNPKNLEMEIPEAPSFDEALEAEKEYVGHHNHRYPTCFVCGPKREMGDGLRIFAGKTEKKSGIYAAPWIPDESFKGEGDKVDRIITASALDCPGFFAMDYDGGALLANMSLHLWDDVTVGEKCVVTGWKIAHQGRKLFSGTALYNEKGQSVAAASALWITI